MRNNEKKYPNKCFVKTNKKTNLLLTITCHYIVELIWLQKEAWIELFCEQYA